VEDRAAAGHRRRAPLVGRVAYPLRPIAPLPQVDFPTLQVPACLPGASPETMASNVAQPLERQFSLIAGLSQMTSQSGTGSTQITLQFDLARPIDAAAPDQQRPRGAGGHAGLAARPVAVQQA
jgi:HAE1 family hydrophobic/amphiphilic exporter-1